MTTKNQTEVDLRRSMEDLRRQMKVLEKKLDPKPMGPAPRAATTATRMIGFRGTPAEEDWVNQRAKAAKMTRSAWMRKELGIPGDL